MMEKELSIDEFKLPFKVFADCVPVRGSLKSILVDLNRNSYFDIPNDLYDLIINCEGKSIFEILTIYGENNRLGIMEYFDFLIKNELIFFTEYPNDFPKIDFSKWEYPSEFYQVILDIKDSINHIDSKLFESLNNLNCKFLEIRIFNRIDLSLIYEILNYSELKSLIGIDISLKFTSYEDVESVKQMFMSFPRVNNVYFYKAPVRKQLYKNGKNAMCNIMLIKDDITSCLSCGIVSPKYFTININSFTKAINYNSCLKGKVSIDHNGEIKNCPSMKKSYGNISNVSLEKAISKKDFKELWGITKDQVSICKDCEFRYVCIDCRAYLENADDIYSKPLKCGYSPYTGEWEEWSKNPLKNQVINYYSKL